MDRTLRLLFILMLAGLGACNLPGLESTTSGPLGETPVFPSINPNPGQHDTTPSLAITIQPTTAVPSITPTMTPTVSPTPSGSISRLTAGAALDIVSLRMLDSSNGWAIGRPAGSGDAQHILRTSNGGALWAEVTPPEQATASGALGSALGYFADSSHAWITYYAGQPNAVPASPVVWRTTDGGTTWQASAPLNTAGLDEVYSPGFLTFTDAQHGWLLAHVGAGMMHDYVVLYATADSGATWKRVVDPTDNDAGIQSCQKTGLLFRDSTNGWLTGDCNGVEAGAMLFRTADGGNTWQSVTLPAPADKPDLMTSMDFNCSVQSPFTIPAGNLFLDVECKTSGATLHYLYITPDNGANWGSRTYPGGSLFFLDNAKGWGLGFDINKTADAGATWQILSTVHWSGAFTFVNESFGWAVATDTQTGAVALVATTNGGASWSVLSPAIGP